VSSTGRQGMKWSVSQPRCWKWRNRFRNIAQKYYTNQSHHFL